jgi:hypothetical protein
MTIEPNLFNYRYHFTLYAYGTVYILSATPIFNQTIYAMNLFIKASKYGIRID